MDFQDFLSALKNLIDLYLSERNDTFTLYSWLDFWVVNFKSGNVKDSTLIQIKSVCKNHLKKYLPDVSLSSLTVLDVQEGLMKIPSSRMREYAKITLSESLKKAKELKYVSENVCEFVSIPSHVRQEGVALTVEQEVEFFSVAVDSAYFGPFFFMRWTGCRPAEAFLVKWSDIDFTNSTVWINGTKTDCSARCVPLFSELYDYLSSLLDRSGYVFSGNVDGAKHAVSRIDVPFHVSCKDFRTTFATRCSEQGVSPHVLQKWLGHTSTKTTNKYYIKVLEDFERSEMAKISAPNYPFCFKP